MFSLAFQVIQRRWLLSSIIVLMMMVTLLNSTATLGLFTYVSTTGSRTVNERYFKESFYMPSPSRQDKQWLQDLTLGAAEVSSDPVFGRVNGLKPYWQAYGIEVNAQPFKFLPLKVVEFDRNWRLPLIDGNLPSHPNHALINGFMAKTYGLKIGDDFAVEGYGVANPYKVVGIIQDVHYESQHNNQQRIFVDQLRAPAITGIAFDVAYESGAEASAAMHQDRNKRESYENPALSYQERRMPTTVVQAYFRKFNRPLVAELVTVDYVRDIRLGPMTKPLFFSLMVWIIQFFLIAFLMFQVMHYLVVNYPLTLVFQGRSRFEHLDVYLNYFMLLILLAYSLSLVILRPYIETVTSVMGHEIGVMSSLQLSAIHIITLGFWMTIFVGINSVLQHWFRRRYRLGMRIGDHLKWRGFKLRLPTQVLALIVGNILVALLLGISFEVSHWSSSVISYPSLWGFPEKAAALNVLGDTRLHSGQVLKGYTYTPVVVMDESPVYARGVVSETGFSEFDIKLVEGRLPNWPNEVVIGLGLAHDQVGLGSVLRYYDVTGLKEGVVVGVANALFENGEILGYIAPCEKTFSFDREATGENVDFMTFVRSHYSFLGQIVTSYLLPVIVSMVLVGFLIIIITYAQMDDPLRSLRLMMRVSNLTWWQLHSMMLLFALLVSGTAFILSKLIWLTCLVPIIHSLSIPSGILPFTLLGWSPNGHIGLYLMFLVNYTMVFIVLTHQVDTRND